MVKQQQNMLDTPLKDSKTYIVIQFLTYIYSAYQTCKRLHLGVNEV